MAKAKNPTVTVEIPNNENPYKKGTAKFKLFNWALSKMSFSKEEFVQHVVEALETQEFESEMTPETCGRAWWNEFKNRHKVFVEFEVSQ